MVRRLVVILTLCAHSIGWAALLPSLEEVGQPLDAKSIQLVWNATNQIPATLNSYEILPRIFSEETISNLVAITGFKEPEKVRATFMPALKGKLVSYKENETQKYLSINPARGHIVYHNFRSIALPRQPNEGVPDKPRVKELAFKLLPLLGIKESELARKPNTNEFQLAHAVREEGRFDKETKKQVTRTIMQGIIMGRSMDGTPFNGRGDCGGVRVSYGNNEQIAELQVVWPTLKVGKKLTLVSTPQIQEWIKKGNAVIEGGEGFNPVNMKKLTVTEIYPTYLVHDVDQAQKTIYPYAMMSGRADTGTTNETVRVSSPIFK